MSFLLRYLGTGPLYNREVVLQLSDLGAHFVSFCCFSLSYVTDTAMLALFIVSESMLFFFFNLVYCYLSAAAVSVTAGVTALYCIKLMLFFFRFRFSLKLNLRGDII